MYWTDYEPTSVCSCYWGRKMPLNELSSMLRGVRVKRIVKKTLPNIIAKMNKFIMNGGSISLKTGNIYLKIRKLDIGRGNLYTHFSRKREPFLTTLITRCLSPRTSSPSPPPPIAPSSSLRNPHSAPCAYFWWVPTANGNYTFSLTLIFFNLVCIPVVNTFSIN